MSTASGATIELARGRSALCALGFWIASLGPTPPASCADYYFSAAGNDLLGDGSLAQPWKSVVKFNQLDFNPGDQAFFRAGDEFVGRLLLDEADSGVDASGRLIAPVRIGSYGGASGESRATVKSPFDSEALLVYNAGGVELSGLVFSSGGWSGPARKSGVAFYTDKATSPSLQRLDYVRVDNIAAHGFRSSGLEVYASSGVGFADVQISNSEFFDNAYAGISVGAQNWRDLVHADVRIDGVDAHHNSGSADDSPHSGHGVVVGQVDGAVIENSVAYGNGLLNGKGNVAIWAWQSNDVTIQRNLAYGNRSPAGGDGGAFDLDGGVTNSVVQYNTSHDNDGAGLLLAQFDGADAMSQNVFRYNLSVNDGRDGYGGISIWGASAGSAARSAVFHNNTIVVDGAAAPAARGAVWFVGNNHADLAFINNMFVALDGSALVSGTAARAKAAFFRNAYWTDGGSLVIEGAVYPSVEAWAFATGQEQLAGEFVAIDADPAFVDAQAFRPHAYSPLVEAATVPGNLPWPAWITSLGLEDLQGVRVFQGEGPDIGAWEIIAGDFNGDGIVDESDLALWTTAVGTEGVNADIVDSDGDNDADGAELLLWQRALGTGVSAAPAAASIPEPTAVMLAAQLTAARIVALRRRRSARTETSRLLFNPIEDVRATDPRAHANSTE